MKLKILSFVIVCLFLFADCETKFNDAKASSIIREAFELTKEDTLKVLDTFMESENIAIVKFKLNEFELSAKIKRYVDSGWQLDGIKTYRLGDWISVEDATIWFNEYRELKRFYQREKEEEERAEEEKKRARKEQPQRYAMKDSMKDITVISTAITDYVTDNRITPKQDGIYDANSEFYQALSPFYVKVLPITDSWGNKFRIYCGKACNGKYGITGCGSKDFIVVSFGRDGKEGDWKYNSSNPEAGLIMVKTEGDLDLDIDLVMWNGSWIRCARLE